MMALTPNLQTWLQHGERGTSSETMAEVFAELPLGTLTGRFARGFPHDPSDFRRCLQLLNQCPEFESRMDKMRTVSPVWNRMIDNWQKMIELYKAEYQTGRCQQLFEFMFELIYEKPYPSK